MTYAVIYGNYFPREVDSYWETKEKAEAQRDLLNDTDPLKSRMWEIEEVSTSEPDRPSPPAEPKCDCPADYYRLGIHEDAHNDYCPASNRYRPPTTEPAESEGKPCNGCGTPEGMPHGAVCPVRPMPGETDWIEVARAHVAAHGAVSAEDIRKINEPYKDAILDVINPPTAAPASVEDRAKALLDDVRDFLHELRVDDCGYAELIARYATLHAQVEISRQRPEIERVAVDEFISKIVDAKCDPVFWNGTPAMIKELREIAQARREENKDDLATL